MHTDSDKIPKKITCWDGLMCLYRTMSTREKKRDEEWIFRGHAKECYPLQSSLERTVTGFGFCIQDMRGIEKKVIHEFKRRLHHYRRDVPAQDDIVEWLALMQHHGAPTRLLDWTYSLFIATFFAVRKPQEGNSAIWAFNKKGLDAEDMLLPWVLPRILSTWPRQRLFLLLRMHMPRSVVCAVNPLRLNETLAIQQGLFLFPGDIRQSFMDNIESVERKGRLHKIRVEICGEERRNFILNLRRMNIDEASLFPGLEGFADSLHTRVAWHEAISNVT